MELKGLLMRRALNGGMEKHIREDGTGSIVAWDKVSTDHGPSSSIGHTGNCRRVGELTSAEEGTGVLTDSLAHAGTVVDNLT